MAVLEFRFFSSKFIIFLAFLQAISFLYYASAYGVHEQLWFNIIYPEEIAYHYKILPARDFGDVITSNYYRIPLVLADPWHACTPLINRHTLRDEVVLVVRGECSFVSKAANVESYGAEAIIITNNDSDDIDTWIDMADDETGRAKDIKIPSFYLLGKDGHKIREALLSNYYKAALINILVNVSNPSAVSQPKWDLW